MMKEIKMPKFDVNDSSVTIIQIYVSDGDFIKKGERIVKAESTKMAREIIANEDGYIKLYAKNFDVKNYGDTIAILYDTEEEYKNAVARIEDTNNNSVSNINATTKAIARAEQLGIDISAVAAAKKEGVIKAIDVEKYAELMKKSAHSEQLKFSTKTINIYDRERVLIIGAGQVSEQVIDILLDDKDKYVAGIVDSYKTTYNSYSYPFFNCDIFNCTDFIDNSYYDTAIVAIGGNKRAMALRKKVYEILKQKGVKFTNAIGNNANIRRAVSIGENNIIMHNCFIGTGAHIGNNNIISYGSCIGHHNNIGSDNLFAPAVSIAGDVTIGDGNIFMTGVNIISFATIGSSIVFPVGYNVMEDVPDGANLIR